jgi:hypothetical protein
MLAYLLLHATNHQGNVDHMPAHPKNSKKFKIQLKRSKIQISVIVVLKAPSRNFGNFMKSIVALIPKHHFTLMIFPIITQIHKKYQCREAFFFKGLSRARQS